MIQYSPSTKLYPCCGHVSDFMYEINNKIFLLLKEHALVQQVILDTLLTKKYFIQDLEMLIGVNAEILHKVRNGEEKLENDSALKLINLFYDKIK